MDLFSLHFGRATALTCRAPIARPSRDWKLVVGIEMALAALLLSAAAALFFFAPWDRGAPQTVSEGAGFNLERLEAALAQYEARKVEHAALLAAPRAVVDPAR